MNVKINNFSELLNYARAAECLGISEGTLRTWVKQNRVPHIKLGGGSLVRFREPELLEYLNNHETIGGPHA